MYAYGFINTFNKGVHMKKIIAAISLCLLITNSTLCFGAKVSKVETKSDSLIANIKMFAKGQRDVFPIPKEGTPETNKLISMLDGVDDDVTLSALNIMMANYDLEIIASEMLSGKATIDEITLFWTYSVIRGRLLKRWEAGNGNIKNVLMLKILPVVTNDKYNQNLRASFIGSADGHMSNIHNKKIPITDSDRNLVMDTMLKIFTDETKQLNMRCPAARLWSWSERRPQTFQQNIKYIENNEKLLAASAQAISHNRTMTDDQLFEKLLKLLETNKNEKTVESILYGLNSLSYENPIRIAKVKNMKEQLLLKEGYKHLKKLYGKL